MLLHWGIACAGKISNDFVNAVQTLPKKHHQIVAVAARSGASAEEFAKSHGIPKSYEGYLKLAEDPDVDIVYIGSLNPQHYEIAKMMLQHDKHVLCEKPLTLNERLTRKLIDLATKKKKFLKEGIWSRSFPAYRQLKRIIDSGAIGEVIQVNVTFGFDLNHVERLKKKEMGGGVILDLGIYGLQFQQFVFKGDTPMRIIALGGINKYGTDDYLSSVWGYQNDRLSTVSITGKANCPNEAYVIGTKGCITVPEFWCPTKLITPEKTYEFPLPQSNAHFNFHNSVGLSYEAEHVRRCLHAGKLESPYITLDESLQLASHMDVLRKQIGVDFPQDYKIKEVKCNHQLAV